MNVVSFQFIALVGTVFLAMMICNNMMIKKGLLMMANTLFVLSFGNVFHGIWLYLTGLYVFVLTSYLQEHKNKLVMICGLFPILISLVFFKYNKYLGFENIIAPLGISFYTFKMISFVVDTYQGKAKSGSLVDTLIYISFFPVLTAGPIHRANHFFEQLNQKYILDYLTIKNAAVLCAMGMFQKLVFADYLAIICKNIFSTAESRGGLLIFGLVLYSFQIYLDFDGYSNIAIGASKMLGFDLGRNFHTPYVSQSIMEFWDRWHISLSAWLKQYIYIPLGGNRKGVLRKYLNILVVFVVSGLWHGSTLNYLIWGIGHGIVNIVENILASWTKNIHFFSHPGWIQRTVKTLINFVIVTLLWVFFRSADLGESLDIFRRMILIDYSSFNYTLAGIGNREMIWLFVILFVTVITDLMRKKTDMIVWLSKRHFIIRWGLYALLILIVLIFGVYGPGYDAADFIYASF